MAIREPIQKTIDGVAVRVCPRTPRTDMTFRSVMIKLSTSTSSLADEYEVNESDIDIAVYEYAMLCARANIEGDVDFRLASARFDEVATHASFKGYLNTDYMRVVNALLDAIRTQDTPVSDVIAPTPPKDAKKN